jgi:hypothetical protein
MKRSESMYNLNRCYYTSINYMYWLQWRRNSFYFEGANFKKMLQHITSYLSWSKSSKAWLKYAKVVVRWVKWGK